jgi:hypothetical protein
VKAAFRGMVPEWGKMNFLQKIFVLKKSYKLRQNYRKGCPETILTTTCQPHKKPSVSGHFIKNKDCKLAPRFAKPLLEMT